MTNKLPAAPNERPAGSEGYGDATAAIKNTKSRPNAPRRVPAKSGGKRSTAAAAGTFGAGYSDSRTVGVYDIGRTVFDKIRGHNRVPRHELPVAPSKQLFPSEPRMLD